MKKFQSAAVLTVEPGFAGTRLSMRAARKPASRWPHRRRAMALAIDEKLAEDKAQGGESGLARFWNEHAVKSGMVLFWGWYGIVNWHAIGQILHLV
jgi:hypothetical protein